MNIRFLDTLVVILEHGYACVRFGARWVAYDA